MSNFDEDEASIAQNRPIELYDIETPTIPYRVTSHPVDVTWQGKTYTAVPMSRGPQEIAQDLTGRELVIYLPISHPFVQRFVTAGIPEHGVLITLSRLQRVSGVAEQQCQGFAGGLSIQGRTAAIRVPALTDDAMKIQLPVISAQKQCNHRLFDKGCSPSPRGDFPFLRSGGPDPAAFTISTTIVSQTMSAGVVTVLVGSLNAQPDEWATFGEVVHLPTGQHRLVLAQHGTTLTINAPFVGATVGDSVSVIAGCAHDVATCARKFNNRINFGGAPLMVAKRKLWAPVGLGVIQQA